MIVKCNGQRLTELPFDKAVEVMRGSGVLDLVVNRPTYYTPDPGEAIFRGSSGYDSGNSSLLESSPLPPPLQGIIPHQAPVPGRHLYPPNQASCARNPTRPRAGSREVQWADIDGKGYVHEIHEIIKRSNDLLYTHNLPRAKQLVFYSSVSHGIMLDKKVQRVNRGRKKKTTMKKEIALILGLETHLFVARLAIFIPVFEYGCGTSRIGC